MAQHRLGDSDEARELLDRLRQLLQQDRWKNDADSQGFLREAECSSNRNRLGGGSPLDIRLGRV